MSLWSNKFLKFHSKILRSLCSSRKFRRERMSLTLLILVFRLERVYFQDLRTLHRFLNLAVIFLAASE